MRIELKHFDLGIDRDIESLEYFIQLYERYIVISCHCYCKQYANPACEENFEPVDKFVSFRQVAYKQYITGLEIYWHIQDIHEQGKYDH